MISMALDAIVSRLDELEYKIQSKFTDVCVVQTKDLHRRNARMVAEECDFVREYTREMMMTIQGFLLLPQLPIHHP